MKLNNIILIASIILISTSCNDDEVFEKEQYKNVFSLISGTDNVYIKYFDLKEEESMGYISFSMGGSNPTDKDVVINLVEDQSYIDSYNNNNYDMDIDKYIRPLDKSRYDIESMQCTIPAGEISAQIPVRIRPRGLSPDSSYFISVKVDSYNASEVNPEKNYLLYSVNIQNYWVKIGEDNKLKKDYNLRAIRVEQGTTNSVNIPGVKNLYPISENAVRIFAGNETDVSDKAVINKLSIVLEVNENNKVTIKPYKEINVKQIDGDSDYPNTFRIVDDGYNLYKTFLLRYNYVSDNGKTYEMKEELRLKLTPEEEKELE